MEPEAAKRRFVAIQKERLRHVELALGETRAGLAELLPLLFHAHDPALPGFNTEATPAGMAAFTPGGMGLDYAKRLARVQGSKNFKVVARRSYDIHCAFLITDTGTLISTPPHRFELCLFLNPAVEQAQRELLQEKGENVATWYGEQGIELNLRLLDAEQLARGDGGLTVGRPAPWRPHLLRDRLYAKGIWLAGRHPVWWLLSPEEEYRYAEEAERLAADPAHNHDVIDLGVPGAIPASELFAASAERLFAAVDCPTRSLLDIFLLESYAREGGSGRLRCRALKRAVYGGETRTGQLDPVMLAYRQVAAALAGAEEFPILHAVRTTLYFQVTDSLTQGGGDSEWRSDLLAELVASWSWGASVLAELDGRAGWKLERVVKERQTLVGAISHAYRQLSALGRTHPEHARDGLEPFNLLRQKLYAAFERKAGKVELVNPGISEALVESHLNILQTGKQGSTLLYRKEDWERERDAAKPLKRAASFIELITWSYFNRLTNKNTLIALMPPEGMVEQRELRSIMQVLQELAPNARLPEAGHDAYTAPATLVGAALFINVGVIDPLTKRTRQGIHLSSDQIDVFSYGSRNESLAETLDLLLLTSRGEVLTLRYRDDNALPDALSEFFSWIPEGAQPPPLKAYCFSSERGQVVAMQFDTLHEEMVKALYASDNGRYLLRFRKGLYLFQRKEGGCSYRRTESVTELIAMLAAPRSTFSALTIRDTTLLETALPTLFAHNKPGVVQFVYQVQGDHAELWILDERGSLYTQRIAYDNDDALISHFQRFFGAVLPRRNAGAANASVGEDKVEYHQYVRAKDGSIHLIPREMDLERSRARYFNVHVIAEMLEDRRNQMTVFCEEEEFSSLEHGEELFNAIARHILARRKSGERYPIYITDIDITRLVTGAAARGGVQTIHFLNYKKRIEERLNEALQRV